jgi:LEA14-like dessication related protein
VLVRPGRRDDVSSTRHRAALGAAALVVGALAAVALGVLGAAALVVGVETRFGAVDDETTVIETNVSVANPNPIGAAADVRVDYAVETNGLRMAAGTREGVSLPPGVSTVAPETRLDNDRIPDRWVTHVRNGESTTLTVLAAVETGVGSLDAPQVTRSIETDLRSSFDSTESRPVDAGLPVVSDPVAVIESSSARWGAVTDGSTAIELAVDARNPKPYPIGRARLPDDVSVNDVAVGDGSTESVVVIPSGATRTIRTTARIDTDRLDDWWVGHLERNQVTTVRIGFAAAFDLGATVVRVPLDPLTHTETAETDLFGTKPATNASARTTQVPPPTASGPRDRAARAATATPAAAAGDPRATDGRAERLSR